MTEFGVSHVLGAPKGWRISYDMDHVRYAADMNQHMRWVQSKNYDERIAGYAVFTWGRLSDHWKPNDIEGECARTIADTGVHLPAVDFGTWLGGATSPPPEKRPCFIKPE